jgi:alpha-tubulin suppressor-like RCC1 family protein
LAISPIQPRVPPPQVAAGAGVSFAVTVEGHIFSWGSDPPLLGHADSAIRPLPHRIAALGGVAIADVAVAKRHVLAVADDGRAFAWGAGAAMGLRVDVAATPTAVGGVDGARTAHCGDEFSLVLTAAGLILACGARPFVGADDADCQTFARVGGVKKAVAVACGAAHVVALTLEGTFVWGRNSHGQLGLPAQALARPTPLPLPGARVFWIAAGGVASFARTDAGLVGWGAVAAEGVGEPRLLAPFLNVPVGHVVSNFGAAAAILSEMIAPPPHLIAHASRLSILTPRFKSSIHPPGLRADASEPQAAGQILYPPPPSPPPPQQT